MNEYLVAAVFVSSAAGWYGGYYFERQKARRAYASLAQTAIHSTNQLFNAAMTLMIEYVPGEDPNKLAQKLIEEGNKRGMQIVAMARVKENSDGNN